MKPTILILLAALAVSGCDYAFKPLIITRVEAIPKKNHFYEVTVNDGKITYITDSLYHVGDTIK